ncbi:beta-ketoacyl synthase chain length factor [Piscinibacter sakaiensis]|uniref:beta-ketoacyl synthase chain length factor n=1 Tax=Piscinibacter sakaiensis TaxID=1547922 RepID=UPI003AABBE3F
MSAQTSPQLRFAIRAIGLVGPGLLDWNQAKPLLAAPAGWQHAPTVLPAPQRLPAAERRRAGEIVKLSLAVADQACTAAAIDPATLATVFAASTGDASNCHALCEALASAERIVSPTRFTNSVHNAAAGYWHIATASRAPSTSLCVFDASFAAGLLEAAVQCVSGERPVLLVAADVPYPEPIGSVRQLSDAFGVALLLTPDDGAQAIASVTLRIAVAGSADACGDPALERLRCGVPSARSLPLLQALASGCSGRLLLDHLGSSLQLVLSPGSAADGH